MEKPAKDELDLNMLNRELVTDLNTERVNSPGDDADFRNRKSILWNRSNETPLTRNEEVGLQFKSPDEFNTTHIVLDTTGIKKKDELKSGKSGRKDNQTRR